MACHMPLPGRVSGPGAADMNINREIAEACLAHTVKGVEGAYQRSDLFERRRSVMQQWADYVTGAPRADVIPLHG